MDKEIWKQLLFAAIFAALVLLMIGFITG